MKTKIKDLRIKHNLTQQNLADKVGVTRMTIVFLEKGTYNPSLKLAKKVSLVLKSNIDDLFIFKEKDLE